MEQFFARTRWYRWSLAIALLAFGVVGGLLQWFNTCEEKALDNGTVVSTCRDPSISDAAVVFAGVLFLLMIAPDFEEAGLFGFSLKRRVAQAEKKAADVERQLAVFAVRLENVATASATANANINIFPGELLTPEVLRAVNQRFDEKRQRYAAGQAVERDIARPVRPVGEEDASLRADLLAVWEELSSILQLTPGARRAERPNEYEIGLARRQRFINLFGEELEVVRAARNAVAHARPVDTEALREAVEVGRKLLALAREDMT